VHGRLVEQRQYGGADVAPAGPVAAVAVEVAREAAATRAPAPLEPAAAVTVSVALAPSVVVMDPGASRIVGVVMHCFPSYPNALVRSRYIGNISQRLVYSCTCGLGEDGGVDVRAATVADVEACLDVQRRSAVVGYAHIFPQDDYPFPDDVVRAEWAERLAAGVPVTLAVVDGEVVGTISVRPPRLESLFVVPERWGSDVGRELHDEALRQIAAADWLAAELDVMVDNARARRFYEKLGWTPDGRTDTSPFPPYPRLLGYRREVMPT
jgi:GNAT superfamily N-acetyltransferase